MITAVIGSLVIIAGMLGLVVWSVQGRVKSTERASASDNARVIAESNLAHAQFELEVTKRALDAANARGDVLEESLNEEIKANPNPDLAANNVRQRVLRVAAAWAVNDKNRVPPAAGGDVSGKTAEAPTPAAEVPANSGPLPTAG